MVPSRLPARLACWTWPRPCTMPTRFSERVSVHRTGRSSRRASQATRSSSGVVPCLAPKPPPTSGVMTWTSSASRPNTIARASRVPWAPCVHAHCVRRPSSHRAAATRPSSGTGAIRWLIIRWVTTTSPTRSSGPTGSPSSSTTLVPMSAYSTSPSSAAASGSRTGTRASTSAQTASAASAACAAVSATIAATGSPT